MTWIDDATDEINRQAGRLVPKGMAMTDDQTSAIIRSHAPNVTRLEAERDRMRLALQRISSDGVCRCDEARKCDYCIAREALKTATAGK